jgi:hypothetical protein
MAPLTVGGPVVISMTVGSRYQTFPLKPLDQTSLLVLRGRSHDYHG